MQIFRTVRVIIELILWIIVLALHFAVPFNFLFFIFDFVFIVSDILFFKHPKKYHHLNIFDIQKYYSITNGILTLLAIVIIAKYWKIVYPGLLSYWESLFK